MTIEERLAALETQFENLNDQQARMLEKIDDLIALKHKGAGAFLLASTLFGAGIIGTAIQIIEWVKGIH